MSDAPETICIRTHRWKAAELSQDYRWTDATEYRRADLPATDAQALANEKVKALVEALEYADRMCQLDLSAMVDWESPDFNQAVFDTSRRISAALVALEEKG